MTSNGEFEQTVTLVCPEGNRYCRRNGTLSARVAAPSPGSGAQVKCQLTLTFEGTTLHGSAANFPDAFERIEQRLETLDIVAIGNNDWDKEWEFREDHPEDFLYLFRPPDYSWMLAPNTTSDPAAWDRYWRGYITRGHNNSGDMWVDDGNLVDAMRRHGLRTVLCIGNGLSNEARALAWAGFEVIALDISPLATQEASSAAPREEYLARLVDRRPPAPNGHVEFVAGDLMDPRCCPGRFDVIIERATLQLWPPAEIATAAQAVTQRLESRGIFFTQTHNGGWVLKGPPRHALRDWFEAEAWEFWQRQTTLTTRLAWLYITSG